MRIRPVRGYAANANFPLLRFASEPAPEWPNQRDNLTARYASGLRHTAHSAPAAVAPHHFGKANSCMISMAYYVWLSAIH